MSGLLSHKEFDEACLDEVKDFNCGEEAWCVSVNEWIKNGDAIKFMKKRKTKILLYYNGENEFVGYGSVGTSNWKSLFPEDPNKRIMLLPFLEVQKEHRGKGYGHFICNHLIEEAQAYFLREQARGVSIAPFLGLLVHPGNFDAKDLYRSVGFGDFGYYYVSTDDGIRYEGMGRFLNLE